MDVTPAGTVKLLEPGTVKVEDCPNAKIALVKIKSSITTTLPKCTKCVEVFSPVVF
jgi:hypothetical protein